MGCKSKQAPVMAVKRLGDDKVTKYMGGEDGIGSGGSGVGGGLGTDDINDDVDFLDGNQLYGGLRGWLEFGGSGGGGGRLGVNDHDDDVDVECLRHRVWR